MTETTARIRWEPLSSGLLLGYVTPGRWLFQIYKTSDDADGTELALMSHLPGQTGDYRYADDPGELKRAAEDWLAGFVSSLGAAFAADATLPQRDSRGMLDLTCDACGATTGTNCHDDDIRCAECGAHRCPHCGGRFGRDD